MFDFAELVVGVVFALAVGLAGADMTDGEGPKDNPCGGGVASAEVCEQVVARAPEVGRVGNTDRHAEQRERARREL